MSGNYLKNWVANAKIQKDAIAHFIKTTFHLIKPYWYSDDKKQARLFILGLVLLVIVQTIFGVGLSFVIAKLFTALEQKSTADLFDALMILLGAVVISAILAMLQVHLSMSLQVRWRQWLTKFYLNKYCLDNRFYQVQLGRYELDNPDQRIAEDIKLVTIETVELGVELLGTIVSLFSFVGLLWVISGPLEFSVLGMDIYIPGYMVWVSILYAAFGTWLGHVIAKPLTKLNFMMQAREADLRYALVRVRENTESIALSKGIVKEETQVVGLLSLVINSWMSIVKYTRRLHGFRAIFSQFNFFFPILISSPRYIAGAIEFGTVMQMANAFQRVEGALTWFLNAYERLAKWKSSVDRLHGLEDALEMAMADISKSRIHVSNSSSKRLTVRDLTVELPDGQSLINDCQLDIDKGEKVLISGRSGGGKSTLFRTISGLWPWGEGQISLPENSHFLSQSSYLPLGSLNNAICYPEAEGTYDADQIKRLLSASHLEQFVDSLEEVKNWSATLSGGEKQRIAVIRAILKKPDYLFLDEATASLDPVSEAIIYDLINQELPDCTIVSIAHKESLKKYHKRFIEVMPQERRVAEVMPAE